MKMGEARYRRDCKRSNCLSQRFAQGAALLYEVGYPKLVQGHYPTESFVLAHNKFLVQYVLHPLPAPWKYPVEVGTLAPWQAADCSLETTYCNCKAQATRKIQQIKSNEKYYHSSMRGVFFFVQRRR